MTIRLLTRSMLVMIMTSLTVSSCFIEDDLLALTENLIAFQGELMVLGKRLENPYSVANMKLAYENLKRSNPQLAALYDPDIRATHLYVRFLPADYTAYDRLIADTSLDLLDYPIDYEILKQGDFYHDPSIPHARPTYQYATVPVKYTAPDGITFEILDALYLPQNDSVLLNIRGRSATGTEQFADDLEDEALNITGNLEEPVPGSDSKGQDGARRRSKWRPAGRVTVWDNRLHQYIPVEGAKVQARRWFTVKTAYTDRSGYYRMSGKFRRKANYRIVWERDKFDIRSGSFGQARFNGPKKREDWNVQIERNGISFHYAHVFRAAYRYYYGDIGGLKRPSFRLKYSVFNKRGNHMARNLGNWSIFGINPNILIYRYSALDGSENDSDEMFSMTCHETAHSTHMERMNAGAIQFLQVSETIRESWAIGVEWFITQKEYKERGIANYAEANYNVQANYPTLYGFQFWNRRRNPALTSLFIDLVDTNNQRNQPFGRFIRGTVTDPVYGYTFAGIESGLLKNVYGVPSLAKELKAHKPSEITDEQIDVLLGYF